MAGKTKAVLVRIEKRMVRALDKVASRNGRSRNQEIVQVLSRHVQESAAALKQASIG